MKNKKLNIEALKVKSFVTGIEKKSSQTAKGGIDTTDITNANWCNTKGWLCGF